jgi:hypothetical protein
MSMATSAPRGFVIDRTDGRAQLPGSLHTNRRLSKWIRLAEGGRVDVFTGDLNTNAFRGLFARRWRNGMLLQLGGQQG